MELLTSDEILKRIEEVVKSARKSVKIASAWIKGRPFESILEFIRDRGVELEVILRASELNDLFITDEKVFRKIQEVGGKVYLCERLHAKFLIVDEEKVILGSANLTEAGLSDLSKGNIEVGVFYDNSEGVVVGELLAYFESIKKDHSHEFGKDLLGFTLNPVKSASFEFILVDDAVGEQSYVEVKLPDGVILGRVVSVYSYDTGFFANPFTSQESKVFAPIEDFKRIFAEGKDREWKKSATYAYLSDKRNRVRIATAQSIGMVRDGRLELIREPFDVGEAVYRASEKSLASLMRKTFSGRDMELPVEIGKLESSEVKVSIDGREVINKHMLIVGTTGSGKSYFTKLFLSGLVERSDSVQVVVFDPHGEYMRPLAERLGEEIIEHVAFPDTLFPINYEDVEALLEGAGALTLLDKRLKEGKKNVSILSKAIKSSLSATQLSSKNLKDLIGSLSGDEVKDVLKFLEDIYGEEALLSQPNVVGMIKSSLSSGKRVVIYDFKRITDPLTRVNLAGIIMQEIFVENKCSCADRVVVLEEAHNFAPEKGYGDTSADKNNLSLLMARKIASEGRKFNLGLITITQRPAQVSKYVLSQMNTQVMFRTMNTHDIGAISTYVEHAGEDMISVLPSLPTGKCVVGGVGVPFPAVVSVG